MPEIGTVVYLKSGGPGMTVTGFNGDKVVCEWFDDENDLCEDSFSVLTLTTDL